MNLSHCIEWASPNVGNSFIFNGCREAHRFTPKSTGMQIRPNERFICHRTQVEKPEHGQWPNKPKTNKWRSRKWCSHCSVSHVHIDVEAKSNRHPAAACVYQPGNPVDWCAHQSIELYSCVNISKRNDFTCRFWRWGCTWTRRSLII